MILFVLCIVIIFVFSIVGASTSYDKYSNDKQQELYLQKYKK